MEIWLTSDTHFSHRKEFLYKPRGFSSATEMNQAIVEQWNSVVKEGDIVYHLGDVALSDTQDAIQYIKQLNGQIIWLRGNHCTVNKVIEIQNACPKIRLLDGMDSSYATILKSGKWSFYLSHYPTLTGNREPWRKVANLCGHAHSPDRWSDWDKRCYHVEMDAHGCYPVNLEQVKDEIRARIIEEREQGVETNSKDRLSDQV